MINPFLKTCLSAEISGRVEFERIYEQHLSLCDALVDKKRDSLSLISL